MQQNGSKCIKCVGVEELDSRSSSKLIKWGKTKSGNQRFRCSHCHRTTVEKYTYQAHLPETNQRIINYLKEGCGILSISRLLNVSPGTVQRRILKIAQRIKKPVVVMNKSYELDELCTYVGNKANRIWVAYAIRSDTKRVVNFSIGKRTNRTLKKVVETLHLPQAVKISTDKLKSYLGLVDQKIHDTTHRGINHIERKNLTLRTHLKRLSRRTICYSKSLLMLNACLMIYFWG